MNTVTQQKTLAETIREHVSTLQAARTALVAERDAATKEVEDLYTAPVSRADALQFCLDYIDTRAAAYLESFGHLAEALDRVAWPRRNDVQGGGAVGYVKGAPLCLRDIEAGMSGDFAQVTATFRDGLRFFGANTEGHRADEAAYFFFGDIIKAKVREHFDRLYPGAETAHPITTLKERRACIDELRTKVAALDADIASLDAELAAIRADANATPSAVAVMPEPVPARNLTAHDIRARDLAIYSDFNGKNADEIAARHGVTRAHVLAIAAQPMAPAA